MDVPRLQIQAVGIVWSTSISPTKFMIFPPHKQYQANFWVTASLPWSLVSVSFKWIQRVWCCYPWEVAPPFLSTITNTSSRSPNTSARSPNTSARSLRRPKSFHSPWLQWIWRHLSWFRRRQQGVYLNIPRRFTLNLLKLFRNFLPLKLLSVWICGRLEWFCVYGIGSGT